MPRSIVDITDTDGQENAIASFVNKSTGIKCFFEGFDFKRFRPYALVNVISNKQEGKSWSTNEFINGVETTYFKDSFLTVDIDIFTDAYDSKGVYVKESSKFYMQRFLQNYEIEDNQTDLSSQNMKVSTLNQFVSNASIKELDQWIKQSTIECTFNYNHEFKLTDSDTITTIDNPTINLDE